LQEGALYFLKGLFLQLLELLQGFGLLQNALMNAIAG